MGATSTRATVDSPNVMIVNDAFVRHFLTNQRGVGTDLAVTLRFPPQGEYSMGAFTIVGVVHNTVFRSLRDGSEPAMYLPFAQRGPSTPYTTVFIGAKSAGGDPALLERSVRAAIASVNDNVTVSFQTLAQEIDDSIVEERLTAFLSGALGGLALLLAAVGVYGITAYAVGQRRREIAIRIALGATAWNVTSVMLRRAAWHRRNRFRFGAGVRFCAHRTRAAVRRRCSQCVFVRYGRVGVDGNRRAGKLCAEFASSARGSNGRAQTRVIQSER